MKVARMCVKGKNEQLSSLVKFFILFDLAAPCRVAGCQSCLMSVYRSVFTGLD